MAHLQETLYINVPVAALDGVVGDLTNLPTFWVGASEPRELTGNPGLGARCKYTQLMMGVHLQLDMRITEERHEEGGGTFWRWEFEGTTSGYLTCHHEPKDGGTQISTDFEYTVPGAVLGKIADRVLVERMQKRDFRHSLENLKEYAEAAATKQPAPAARAASAQ
jgi:uncharacterized membrane protein